MSKAVQTAIRPLGAADTTLLNAMLGARAIALYGKLGVREEVLHFDIPVTRTTG